MAAARASTVTLMVTVAVTPAPCQENILIIPMKAQKIWSAGGARVGRSIRRKACGAVVSMLLLGGCGPGCGQRGNRGRTSSGREGARVATASPGFPGGPNGATACPGPSHGDGGTAVRGRTRFAVFGDYGNSSDNEAAVAALVKGWNPDFVITTGDNNYPVGSADTIDGNIGQYYHDFIGPYLGHYGCGAAENRFFPSLGNHDWETPEALPYRNYFSLPGNERYYEVVFGDVQMFALDSDPREPDGVTADSTQASWLRQRLQTRRAPWRVVFMHHPPYSSGPHGSSPHMQWPFKPWGADIVFAGHDHDYERLEVGGLPYVVDGVGGSMLYTLGSPVAGSLVRFDSAFGAVLVDATATRFKLQFFTTRGELIDQLALDVAP